MKQSERPVAESDEQQLARLQDMERRVRALLKHPELTKVMLLEALTGPRGTE